MSKFEQYLLTLLEDIGTTTLDMAQAPVRINANDGSAGNSNKIFKRSLKRKKKARRKKDENS